MAGRSALIGVPVRHQSARDAETAACNSLLLQTQSDGRRRRTFDAIRCAATWAVHRCQCFGSIAIHWTIALDHAKVDWAGVTLLTSIAFFAFVSRCTFLAGRTLRSLWPGLALNASHALNAGSALRPGRSLGADLTFRPRRSSQTLRTHLASLTLRSRRSGIPAAGAERNGDANDEYRKNPHDAPRCVVSGVSYLVTGSSRAINPRRRQSNVLDLGQRPSRE